MAAREEPATGAEPRLTHVDETGAARMVDVSAKPRVKRTARARAFVELAPATVALVRANALEKGDVLAVAVQDVGQVGVVGGHLQHGVAALVVPGPQHPPQVDDVDQRQHDVEAAHSNPCCRYQSAVR